MTQRAVPGAWRKANDCTYGVCVCETEREGLGMAGVTLPHTEVVSRSRFHFQEVETLPGEGCVSGHNLT